MANVGELIAHVKANVTDFTAKMGEVIGTVQRTESRFASLGNASRLMQTAMTGAAATAAVKFFNIGVESEAMGLRYRAVFGENTAALDEWVASNRESFGMAVDDMQGLVAQTANMLTPLGLTAEAAGQTATRILELADAWSVWSGGQISSAAAAAALTKGVMGQTRGLVELGMNAAVVRDIESDLTATMENGAAPADLLADSMARLDRITEQSGAAMQVYEEAMQGGAGAQRSMQTALNELKDTFGQALVQLAPFVEGVAGLLSVLGQIPGAVAVAGGAMMGFMVGGPAGAVVGGLVGLSTMMVGVGSAAREMGERITAAAGGSETALAELSAAARVMQGNGVFGDVGDRAAWAAENMDLLRDAVDAVNDAVGGFIRGAFPGWTEGLEEAGQTIQDITPDMEQLEEQFLRQSRAVSEVIDAEARLNDLRRAAVDPLFALIDANGRVAQAERDMAAAMATGDLEEQTAAAEDAYRAQLDWNDAIRELDTRMAVGQLTELLRQAGWTEEAIARIIATIGVLNRTQIDDKWFTVHAQAAGNAGQGGQALNWMTQQITGGGQQERIGQKNPRPVVVNVGQAIGDEASIERMVATALKRALQRGDT